MFSNTRSIQQLAFQTWSNELEVYNTIKHLEAQYNRYLQQKGKDPQIESLTSCPCITTYTQLLRERSWGIQMEGITMPPQQEQTKLISWDRLQMDDSPRAILIVEQETLPLHKPISRGKYTPYFGSMTRMRAKRAPPPGSGGRKHGFKPEAADGVAWMGKRQPYTNNID